MNQVEFEKRRVAQIKAFNVMSGNQTMKIIDLIELLLEREPSELIVLPGYFMAALENPGKFGSISSLQYPGRLLPSSRTEENRM